MAEINYIKWDREMLSQIIGNLRSEKEALSEARKFYSQLKESVDHDWMSIAGTVFEVNMAIDLWEVDQLIQLLEIIIELLEKIVNQIYCSCESEIKNKVTVMRSQLAGV